MGSGWNVTTFWETALGQALLPFDCTTRTPTSRRKARHIPSNFELGFLIFALPTPLSIYQQHHDKCYEKAIDNPSISPQELYYSCSPRVHRAVHVVFLIQVNFFIDMCIQVVDFVALIRPDCLIMVRPVVTRHCYRNFLSLVRCAEFR